MYLQSLGLAEHKCSEAIKLIVETMTEEEIEGPLPSRTSQGRIASEMKALAMQRVAEVTNGQKHMTLKYDATTDRRGRHITEVEVATNTKTLLNGMRSQPSRTAAEYVRTITDSLTDIDKHANREGDDTMLSNISNTMTDRCIVNNAIDKRLEERSGASTKAIDKRLEEIRGKT